MLAVIGKKLAQTQKFLEDGTRIPVTIVATPGNSVMTHKTQDKNGYWAIQLGFGERKNANKPQLGQAAKAQLKKAPLFMHEAKMTDKEAESLPEVGSVVDAATVLEAGDMVDVKGFSKGKGFAGGVKRYHFRGGPKTHGQSDRHRAPGSIGSGTTPGRVYKGKRMAGKMGNENVTLKNLEVVEVGKDFVWVKGVVPGVIGAVVVIKPTGKKNKKFVAVLKPEDTSSKKQETNEEKVVEEAPVVEVSNEEVKVEIPVEETKEEVKEAESNSVQEENKAETSDGSKQEKKEEEVK